MWVCKWLVQPIHTRKVMWHCGQGMVAAVGSILACLLCSDIPQWLSQAFTLVEAYDGLIALQNCLLLLMSIFS